MVKYFVADSYKNYKYDITKAYRNNNGKLVVKAKISCPRCGGTGIYAVGVENGHIKPHPCFNGICLQCGSTGVLEKEVRLYTQAEYDSMKRNNERAKQKKEEEMKAGAEKKRQDWLQKNGFDAEGNTYIMIGLNTYEIKDELKAKGWKYNDFLRWHAASPAGYEDNVYKMHWTEGFQTTAWGDMHPISGIQAKVDALINDAKPQSNSDWVGEVGKRLHDIPVTLVSIYAFEGRYGLSQVVKFVDENQNILTWFTSVEIKLEVGDSCFLSGTVKEHSEYKGERNTVLTRCKIM